jgi:tetratricopeptide (TPR) repeat protein
MRGVARTIATIVVMLHVAIAHAEPSPEQLFDEGQAAYDHGDYATAIAKWTDSYRLSKQPLLLLNLAQAYRLGGDCQHALADYREYLAADPSPGEQHDLAAGFVRELEPKCGSPSPPAQVDRVEQPVEVHPRPGHSTKIAGLVTGGAGVAVMATGLLFGRRASALGDEVTQDCAASCSWSIEKTKEANGQRDATVGKALDGVGLGAIAIGVGMYLYGAHAEAPTLTVQPIASGASLSWSGRW